MQLQLGVSLATRGKSLHQKANRNLLLDHAAIQCMQYISSQIAAHDKTS